MSYLLHVFPLISLHELTPITDAYQWNAHDHLEWTINQDITSHKRISGTIVILYENNFCRYQLYGFVPEKAKLVERQF